MRATVGGSDQCSGGAASASSTIAGSPANAFDGNTSTEWTSSTFPQWIKYTFASDVEVLEFTISSGTVSGDSPKDFRLEYSDNDADWTSVYSKTEEINWATQETRTYGVVLYFDGTVPNIEAPLNKLYTYDMKRHISPQGGDIVSCSISGEPSWLSIDNDGIMSGTPTETTDNTGIIVSCTKATTEDSNSFNVRAVDGGMGVHKFWRLYVTDVESGDFASVAEMQLRDLIGGSDQCSGGTIEVSSFFGQPSYQDFNGAKAFDDDISTKWNSDVFVSVTPQWIKYIFNVATWVSEVAILSASSEVNNDRYPKTFEIQFSDEDISYIAAHSVVGAAAWGTSETRLYELGDPYIPPQIIIIGCPGRV